MARLSSTRTPLQFLKTLELPLALNAPRNSKYCPGRFEEEVQAFSDFGQSSRTFATRYNKPDGNPGAVATYVNEFWTARQRQAHSLHEISYRACFKPQLPRFFIERLTRPGDRVYDPFMGRGTTPLEAALLGRVPMGNDINPLSITLTLPRLQPPTLPEIEARLREIPLDQPADEPEGLLAFYHPATLRAISSLKRYLLTRTATGARDVIDEWIAMLSLNRLTGHSPGFFSVYTLPPNQATSVTAQLKINEKRKQTPTAKNVLAIILKKSRQLLGDLTAEECRVLHQTSGRQLLLTGPANRTPAIPDACVDLVVTSPPFLNVVQYATDNWLRCWFLGIDASQVELTLPNNVERWERVMTDVLRELYRVVKPGGYVAFEVGEVMSGTVLLEKSVLPCGITAGFTPRMVVINDQKFTKTANCWGVDNMNKGTNTNRIVVLQK